ncbi:prostatic acid phosphatase isoform X2 [Drosophila erecta]|uniref:acid phosphatase n=2 Tax=Drosophila erecta TaxID=7220 RepID=B3P815_DROER|nr:prostatic acid phosphatase isoform X2 [Drosophila erecta]XP_026831712.1 prostatic acid phosphatase isoform X2 [Drosophila erecta]
MWSHASQHCLILICVVCVLSFGLANTLSGYAEGHPVEISATLPGQLKFVHVIFRHGDRTPVDPYPLDPWGDRKFWSTGWGQLTNLGKQEHYDLGKWLRNRYSKILPPLYSNENIYVQSTDVDRTLMSAQSNLAGLYEPQGEDIWNTDISWQPIPIHTLPEKDDPIVAAKAPCPAYDYELASLEASPEFKALTEKHKDLFAYLSEKGGRPVKTFIDAQYLNNTLFIENLYNMTLPEWTKKVYGGEELTYVSNFAFAISSYTRKLARLKAGPLLKDIFQRFQKKSAGRLSPDRSMWIYSAHDTTVASVLNALKLFELHSPPYTACIMMELRVDETNTPLVSIFYKNTTAEPLPLDIPGCGPSCPLAKLLNIYQDVLPVDWVRECKVSTMMMTYEEANLTTATGILILIVIVLLFASYGLMIYYRRRNYKLYTSYSQMA